MIEEWRDVVGFDEYSVSSNGDVKRKERRKVRKDGSIGYMKEKVMAPSDNCRGYFQVSLRSNGKTYCKLVHRIVIDAFSCETSSDTKMSVDHINGNKSDNRIENLRYITHRENVAKHYSKLRNLPTGVAKDKFGYRAYAKVNNKTVHIGSYKTIDDASNAYIEFVSKL